MKYITALVLVSLAVGCCSTEDTLSGVWTVNDPFFTATYLVEKSGRAYNGIVLAYNDGTTRYQHQGKETHYVFTNVKAHEGQYVDGISGATPKADHVARFSIQPIHPDTLAVTTYVIGRPLVETWARKTK